jgi:phage-related protein
MSSWSIVYYVDEHGWTPVLDFLRTLTLKERNAVVRHIDLLEEFGPLAPDLVHVQGDIWEIKAGPARVFYVAYTGRRFLILHGYYKRGRKAPRREIKTAERRLADFVARDR